MSDRSITQREAGSMPDGDLCVECAVSMTQSKEDSMSYKSFEDLCKLLDEEIDTLGRQFDQQKQEMGALDQKVDRLSEKQDKTRAKLDKEKAVLNDLKARVEKEEAAWAKLKGFVGAALVTVVALVTAVHTSSTPFDRRLWLAGPGSRRTHGRQ